MSSNESERNSGYLQVKGSTSQLEREFSAQENWRGLAEKRTPRLEAGHVGYRRAGHLTEVPQSSLCRVGPLLRNGSLLRGYTKVGEAKYMVKNTCAIDSLLQVRYISECFHFVWSLATVKQYRCAALEQL